MIRSASATIRSSIASRSSGKPSASPWCSRRTRPRAWNVTTKGVPSTAFTSAATRPDMKKLAWTRSYGFALAGLQNERR